MARQQNLIKGISNVMSSFTFIVFIFFNIISINGFVVRQKLSRPLHHNYHPIQAAISKSQSNKSKDQPRTNSQIKSQDDEKILETLDFDNIPPSSPLIPLLNSAINATALRSAETSDMGHDPFRYEWGTWVNEDSLAYLMTKVDEVRLNQGVFDSFLNENSDSNDKSNAIRLKVAGGRDWDCILHILPTNSEWSGRWPTGSWIIVKALTGVIETSALRGPDRNGVYVKKTSKDLRGGSDGSLGGGKSTAGVECIKYIGGPLRRFTGKSGKGSLLEIVIRPPTGGFKQDPIKSLLSPTDAFSIVVLDPPIEETKSKSKSKKGNQKEKKEEDLLSLNNKLTDTLSTNVGGLGDQLRSIARRVLASRSNPEATKRLGVSHVRGILLSGPPGCGKTLMARELANLLGAREPQIVNGPEILDKFIGEAEKKVRDLFLPAELEYNELGEDSALHMIILDEMDAIARKRGSMTSDTTGVRDSVVNQLLAKMDGVKEASNVLVVGLTNRPELLDPALLRPGRLEVQLRVELPDLIGRRDILNIHTRQMRSQGALSSAAIAFIEDIESKIGLPARTEYFSGAELAGLVRSAASFALARTIEDPTDEGIVYVPDLEQALQEVRPALGKQDEVLHMRYPLGIVLYSSAIRQIVTDLKRFITPIPSPRPRIQSLLLAGSGTQGGTGVTALGAYAASQASITGSANYVRCVTSLDILASEGGGGEEARAAALVDRFSEAKEMSHSLVFLDDVDQICAGSGPFGYSSIMLSTLRALLRSPPVSANIGSQQGDKFEGRSCLVLAATSRPDSIILQEIFDETICKRIKKSDFQKMNSSLLTKLCI